MNTVETLHLFQKLYQEMRRKEIVKVGRNNERNIGGDSPFICGQEKLWNCYT